MELHWSRIAFLAVALLTVALLTVVVGGFFVRCVFGRRACGRAPLTREPVVEPRRSSSRFFPGLIAGVLACLLLAGVILNFNLSPRRVVPGVDVPADTVASEQGIEQLLAQFRKQASNPSTPIPLTVPRETEENLPPAEPELGAADEILADTAAAETSGEESAETFPVVVFEQTEPNGRNVKALPEWAGEESVVDFADTGLPGVIKTGQQATPEDAEKEALLQLRLGLAKTFAVAQPAAAGWLPPEKVVLEAGVVTRRAIERSEVTVGDFTEPIFRAYWEITRPDDLESKLFAAWRPEALKSRLLLVGGGIALFTLLFGSLAGFLRVDDATRGKYRKQLGWGTAALWIVAGLVLVRIAAGLALATVA